MYKWKNYF